MDLVRTIFGILYLYDFSYAPHSCTFVAYKERVSRQEHPPHPPHTTHPPPVSPTPVMVLYHRTTPTNPPQCFHLSWILCTWTGSPSRILSLVRTAKKKIPSHAPPSPTHHPTPNTHPLRLPPTTLTLTLTRRGSRSTSSASPHPRAPRRRPNPNPNT